MKLSWPDKVFDYQVMYWDKKNKRINYSLSDSIGPRCRLLHCDNLKLVFHQTELE